MGRDINFRINVLGCGSAKPTLEHNPSCMVLEHGSDLFMIDCGEGAQKEMLKQRLKMSRLGHVFLTHLHGDHVLGLPGLVSTLALDKKRGGLTIHTTEEGRQMLTTIFGYFDSDSDFEVRFEVFDPTREEIVYEDKTMTVRTLPLRHRVPAVGFVFEEKPKSRHIIGEMIERFGIPFSAIPAIKAGEDFTTTEGTVIPASELTSAPTPSHSYAHLSDTLYLPELAEKIKGVDLLYHESTYLKENAREATERFHSTAAQAAMMARDADAGALLLGHYSSRYRHDSLFLEEAREIFPRTVLADEGLTLDIPVSEVEIISARR